MKKYYLILMVALVTTPAYSVPAAANSGLLYQPNQSVFGRKFSEWSAEWWQYAGSIPQAANPILDPTGGFCTLIQHGPVWFFEGTQGGIANRQCTIPEGVALFFPLINLADVNTTNQPVSELRAEIAGCMDAATNLSLVLDGQVIPARTLKQSRVRSVPFALTYPDQGLPGDPPIPADIYSPVVDDGYYVMLKPLSVGHHTLHFTGKTPGCDYPPTNFHADGFSEDVTYDLTVKPVSLH